MTVYALWVHNRINTTPPYLLAVYADADVAEMRGAMFDWHYVNEMKVQ